MVPGRLTRYSCSRCRSLWPYDGLPTWCACSSLLIVLICAGLVAAIDHVHVRLTERDLLDSIVTLPAVFRDWLSALVQLGAVLFPAACLAIVVGGRRLGLAWRLLLAAVDRNDRCGAALRTSARPRRGRRRGASC